MEYVVIMFIVVVIFLLYKYAPKEYITNTDEVEPDDTWEKRYLSLVQEIWLSSDQEIEEYSYEEEHKDVIEEIHAMNTAIHEKRRTDETI